MSATYLQPTTISFLARKAEYELYQLQAEIRDAESLLAKLESEAIRRDWVSVCGPAEYEAKVLDTRRRIEMMRACLPGQQALVDKWRYRNERGTV